MGGLRKGAARATLSIAVFVLALAGLELLARGARDASADVGALRSNSWKVCGAFDGQYGWVNHPGALASIETSDFAYQARINSTGFRDPERDPERAPDTQRVVLLGDSVAWGWGVDDGERFSDLLDTRLGAGVEVHNLAVPGYGTDQQYWSLLEHGLALEPDVVLLAFVLNDVVEVQKSEVYGMAKPRYLRDAQGQWGIVNQPVRDVRGPLRRWGARHWRELVASSALLSEIDRGAGSEVVASAPRKGPMRPPTPAFLRRLHQHADRISDPNSVTYMLLERIAATCAERGIPLLAFNVAHQHDQYLYEPRFPAPAIEKPGRFQTYVTRKLAKAGRLIGFETLSTDPALLRAVAAGQPLHCGDGHLNQRGNQVIADVLEPVLRRQLAR